MNGTKGVWVFVTLGRILLLLAVLALFAAWLTQLTGGTLLGTPPQYLFNDAIALALLGIGMFLDAFWHGQPPVRSHGSG